jgi:nucleoside-diphosphate-sugar epimerase
MAELSRGIDHLFHQAAISSVPPSVKDPVTTTDVNATVTATVLDAARKADVDTAVVASSTAVYGSTAELPRTESIIQHPKSPYPSRSSTPRNSPCNRDFSDTDTVALRYFNVFGPRQNTKHDCATVIPKFINLCSMVDGPRFSEMKDNRKISSLGSERCLSGEAFYVASGRQSTINELVEVLTGIWRQTSDFIYDDPRLGDIRYSYADISKACRMLDYHPEGPFDDGLKQTKNSEPTRDN